MLARWMRRVAVAAPGLFLIVNDASAHHVMGGKTPATFAEGVLSGLGHPIIGPDHLAFLVALGVAVGVFRLSLANPFLFLVAMAGGVAVHVAGMALPGAELIVAASVLLAGALLAVERRIASGWWTARRYAQTLLNICCSSPRIPRRTRRSRVGEVARIVARSPRGSSHRSAGASSSSA